MSQNILRTKDTPAVSAIPEEIQISYTMLHTAQQTLSDLDKSIDELSKLVENLKRQSEKLADKPTQ